MSSRLNNNLFIVGEKHIEENLNFECIYFLLKYPFTTLDNFKKIQKLMPTISNNIKNFFKKIFFKKLLELIILNFETKIIDFFNEKYKDLCFYYDKNIITINYKNTWKFTEWYKEKQKINLL